MKRKTAKVPKLVSAYFADIGAKGGRNGRGDSKRKGAKARWDKARAEAAA